MPKKKSERASSRRDGVAVSRRALLAGAGALGAASATSPAAAQDGRWWDRVFGGAAASTTRAEREGPRTEPEINDLREGPMPWRSDEMLQLMERAVERYQQIAENGWQRVPVGRMLRVGDDDDRVVPLKRRLGQAGMLRGQPGYFASTQFDERLEDSIRNFQEQFGLRVTGRVDQPTFAQLNVPAQVRLEQLRLNQRRIRDLLHGRIEDRYVLVNVAAYQLEAVEAFEVRRRHRVIVGKPDRQTPSVKATIRAFNFFPYWRVPDSVAQLDLIPRLRKEPEYLEKERIRAFTPSGQEIQTASVNWSTADAKSIKFRQDPGPQNALGLVRIDSGIL